MNKILIILGILIAVSMSGCTDTVNDNFEIEDPNLITDARFEIDSIEMSDTELLYVIYDKENDVVIYCVDGTRADAIDAIPMNEIEYWKNYNDTESVETL